MFKLLDQQYDDLLSELEYITTKLEKNHEKLEYFQIEREYLKESLRSLIKDSKKLRKLLLFKGLNL